MSAHTGQYTVTGGGGADDITCTTGQVFLTYSAVSESTGTPKPRSALFWRSGMTAPALAANFEGLRDFFLAARFTDAMGADNAWVADGALFEFANAVRATAAIVDPMEQAVVDPHQLQALKYLVVVTRSLDTLLGQNLAAALGLSVGFSTLDGD